MRTRSTKTAPSSVTENGSKLPMTTEPAKPYKTLILPSGTSDDARFVSIENPRTNDLTRYFFCPKLGLYEFTTISPSGPRSILFTPSSGPGQGKSQRDGEEKDAETTEGGSEEKTHTSNPLTTCKSGSSADALIVKNAQLCVATPVDIVFFLLPILSPASEKPDAKKLFQPLDDMLDSRDGLSKHLRNILLHPTFKSKIETRMKNVCDTVEAGDEIMFRLNEEKLLCEVLRKAERIAANRLPPSLEEKFVLRALELPVLSIKREDTITTSVSEVTTTTESASLEPSESQTSNTTTTTATSLESTPIDASTPATETPPTEPTTPAGIPSLLRIRTALTFIQSSYVPPHITTKLEALLNSTSSTTKTPLPIDFTPLTAHLTHIATLRAQAAASRSLSDFSRKRNLADDDETAAIREEKRRKKEEDEKKKKAGGSRAVRDLKKVDTSGMKKLSAFFGKKTAKGK
ncbi:hypothetical protein AJ80_02603 [Polytolypa hystricis UAMH7299]|uniref:Ribonuclease H2 subunit B n=1 Tax=Polytolypa hystricis (strain UAMH7299) TaxID=1447883 RepID=A0A2B7YQ99_POLH7|nr:hypothetical protein AJ80_02603 [Polytolypa hystricis UAMH7299]